MNPFKEKAGKVFSGVKNWSDLYSYSYDKNNVDPYTKTRVILMNGAEYEANWFSHQFSRHCKNNDLRREIALARYVEKQQQMKISTLKPLNETVLETTISYEQLAVDLTAVLAKNEPEPEVKAALDFALLEDFDHLYRYADLLEMEHGIHAEKLVGQYTEIMPGRPTISHHRHPFDNIKNHIQNKRAAPITKLNVSIITAAEQQTMNYYMNIAGFYTSDLGRRLYQEIGLVEEEHVTQYGSLLDPDVTWLEGLLCHEYTECFLYYSCFMDETDSEIKKIWEQYFQEEISHLHKAADLLEKYEKREWQQIIPGGEFPKLLKLEPNISYVRNVLEKTVNSTSEREKYTDVSSLSQNSDFMNFQRKINEKVSVVPSHEVIEKHIEENKKDYRFETEVHPIKELKGGSDNTTVGR